MQTNVDMLLMVEKGIRGGICYAIHRYAEANNKYIKNYDQNKESSYIQYLDLDFIKNYDEDSDKGYILVECPKNLHDLHSYLSFSPERMKINKCIKLVCNLYDKNSYAVHIRSLKQTLDHGLILKKFHRVIQFNQEAWLKEYIDMNTEL